MQVWLKWRNLPSKILLAILPEVEVICEADGEGEGIWTLWQCLSFKVEGKAHSWAKSTRGGIARYDPGHFYKRRRH